MKVPHKEPPLGWFAITILLPCLAPLIASLIFRLLPLPGRVRMQLCWIAIGLCASAQYELAQKSPSSDDWTGGSISVLLVLSSLVAAGGAMFPTKHAPKRGLAWIKHYRCFVVSLLVWAAASAVYSVVHYSD